MEHGKKDFLEQYLVKQKELGKRQREYKKILLTRLKTRKQTILESSYLNAINLLRLEKDDLRAQLWVANGITHQRDNRAYLSNIQCHVTCQEHLADHVRQLKVSITNLEREIGRVTRQVYDLNRKTVPDSLFLARVAKLRHKMHILENQLEVGVRRECGCTANNATLREEINRLLNYRQFFNDSYMKLVQRLNSDRKYLIDLVEYAVLSFDNCIEVYEKMDYLNKKEAKESEQYKAELQELMRQAAADGDQNNFLEAKGKERTLADLQPKEYRRREEFRRIHSKKISLYSKILENILNYTYSDNVDLVIEKFQKQESLYYSFFNYANEISYHMTLLNNAVNQLYSEIGSLKRGNADSLQNQLETIESLQERLAEKRVENGKLKKIRQENDERLQHLLGGISAMFEASRSDATPLQVLLGNHTQVNLFNVRRFLKILEKRIFDLTANVYIMERRDADPKKVMVVKDCDKTVEQPTQLQDIVLTQQCPECAEGEAFGADGTAVQMDTREEAKHKLYEKVNQPEMQYRLHSISQCRLPHSRILAAKRFA